MVSPTTSVAMRWREMESKTPCGVITPLLQYSRLRMRTHVEVVVHVHLCPPIPVPLHLVHHTFKLPVYAEHVRLEAGKVGDRKRRSEETAIAAVDGGVEDVEDGVGVLK